MTRVQAVRSLARPHGPAKLTGPQPHDTLSFDELRSGARATKTATLRRGTYRLWCSLPGHEAAGMHAVLRVN